MTCPKCGMENQNDAIFCLNCGNNLKNSDNNINQTIFNNQESDAQVSQMPFDNQNNNGQPSSINDNEIIKDINTNDVNNASVISQMQDTGINNQNMTSIESENNSINNLSEKKKIPIKLIIIIVCALAIILVLLIIFKGKGTINTKLGNEGFNDLSLGSKYRYDMDIPILIEKDGKQGYISTKGDFILEQKYHDLNEYKGGYAIGTYDSINEAGYYHYLIDKTGKKVLNGLDNYYYIEKTDMRIIDGKVYDEKLNIISNEQYKVSYLSNPYYYYFCTIDKTRCGILDSKLKELYSLDTNYDSYDTFKKSEYYDPNNIYVVFDNFSDNKEMVVSLKTGKVLSTTDTKKYLYSIDDVNGIVHKFNHDDFSDITYMYFHNDELVYESTSKLEIYDYKKQILLIDDSDEYKYYDAINKKMVNISNEKSSKKYGKSYLNYEIFDNEDKSTSTIYEGMTKNDKVVLPAKYDNISFIEKDLFDYMLIYNKKELFIVVHDNAIYLYDLKSKKENKIYDTTNGDYGSCHNWGSYIECTNYYDEDILLYNVITGKSKIFKGIKEYDVSLYDNYLTIYNSGKKEYYNIKMEKFYEQ